MGQPVGCRGTETDLRLGSVLEMKMAIHIEQVCLGVKGVVCHCYKVVDLVARGSRQRHEAFQDT